LQEYLNKKGIKPKYLGYSSCLDLTGQQVLDLKQHMETSQNHYISSVWELSNKQVFRGAESP